MEADSEDSRPRKQVGQSSGPSAVHKSFRLIKRLQKLGGETKTTAYAVLSLAFSLGGT